MEIEGETFIKNEFVYNYHISRALKENWNHYIITKNILLTL